MHASNVLTPRRAMQHKVISALVILFAIGIIIMMIFLIVTKGS
jgi:hypothetical protein